MLPIATIATEKGSPVHPELPTSHSDLEQARAIIRAKETKEHRKAICFGLAILLLLACYFFDNITPRPFTDPFSELPLDLDAFDDFGNDDDAICRQPAPRVPQQNQNITERNYDGLFRDPEWRKEAGERLAQSVRIDTQTFDHLRDIMPTPEGTPDIPERAGFDKFKEWIAKAYPLTHKHLKRELVNRYALLYTWEGKEDVKTAKPLVLCSHIDTVPVPASSLDQWVHPPFSGHFDGEYIWGRGSVDTKNTLVAIVEAVENLLAAGFKPKRTVILAFGFDEEISGYQGARFLSKKLLDRLGPGGVELLIDEGPGIGTEYGATFASIGISEKGYTDSTLTLSTAGGHSSIPPKHTNIGLMARIIANIEENVYTPELSDDNPFLLNLQCTAKYGPEMNPWLKKAIRNVDKVRPALVKYLARDVQTRYMMQTSQAVTMINGGVKLNALPEQTIASINQRIAMHSSVETVEHHLIGLLTHLSDPSRLALNFTSTNHLNVTKTHFETPDAVGALHYETFIPALQPAPVSPVDTPAWDLIAGTVRRVSARNWEVKEGKEEKEEEEEGIIVRPELMPANTDTRHYWDLTKNIFRYDPIRADKIFGIHTVNERIALSSFIESVAFFHEIVRNFQEVEF